MDEDLKRKLLEKMCSVVESEGLGLYIISEPLPIRKEMVESFFGAEHPIFFHPGAGDKLIFNLILDRIIANIYSEDRSHTNKATIAMKIMANYYFPDYSEFDRQQLEEARELDRK